MRLGVKEGYLATRPFGLPFVHVCTAGNHLMYWHAAAALAMALALLASQLDTADALDTCCSVPTHAILLRVILFCFDVCCAALRQAVLVPYG